MSKLIFFLYSVFTVILFLATGISKAPAFAAEPLEGIKLRELKTIDEGGCVYAGNEAEGVLSKRDGYVLTLDCAPIMFFNLIFWALSFAGLVALILVILGGFKYMTSGGDQKAVEGGKKTITWALIGLVVILLSFAIVRFIADVTGMECLTRFGFIGTCGP